MRNVFDQYEGVENRVTHALMTSLAEDSRLLRSFVRDLLHIRIPNGLKLEVEEQAIPGQRVANDEESEERGLPDGWIHDGGRWAVLIENKAGARVGSGQLQRHLETARRRGFENVNLVLISPAANTSTLPKETMVLSWEGVYSWLRGWSLNSAWARRTAEFLEISEARMIEKGQRLPARMTTFSGVPFGPDHPYNYREARLVLDQAMAKLRVRADLRRALGVDPSNEGRQAITGRDGESVWNVLRLRSGVAGREFTKHPHLTLGIEHDRVSVQLTIPNSIATPLRRNLAELSEDRFREVLAQIERNLRRVTSRAPRAAPWFIGVQRRFRARTAPPTVDARLEFDLRAAVSASGSARSPVKAQPMLLGAAYQALQNRRPNYQMAVGVVFPYRGCAAVLRDGSSLDLFAEAWIACKPMLAEITRTSGRRPR